MGNKWFGTDGVRGVANVFPLTADFALKLACASGQLLCQDKRKVIIAKDTRVSGDMLETALASGFMSMGVDVVLLGVLPTPALSMVTPEFDVDMAVMITASHNPFQDNGIKLINGSGCKFSDEVTAQLEAAIVKNEFVFEAEKIGRLSQDASAAELYKAMIKKAAPGNQPLKGLRVVLDCANGCFSEIMPEVFKDLGAGVIAIANNPNGYNVNKDCGSVHPEVMMKTVVDSHAHIGIACDGDGDRIIVCNEKGEKINAEQVIAFLTKYMKDENLLNGKAVVSTVLSNTGLESYVHALGLEYYSTNVGERYVIDKMNEITASVGGEESGHVIISNYSRTGDALVVGLVLCLGLIKNGCKMSEIFPVFAFDPYVFVNPRFATKEKIKEALDDAGVKKAIAEGEDKIKGKGRIVVRPSGTEPLIRIWICGRDENVVKDIAAKIIAEIEKFQ